MRKNNTTIRKIALIYIGNGSFFPGMPARDIYADEVELRGGKQVLLESGLYKEPEAKAAPKED